jgi:hypothetical protein
MDSSKPDDKVKRQQDDRRGAIVKIDAASTFPDTMSPDAAAAYLGVAPSTLAMWRCTKRYPLPYIKVGRLVQYRKNHLDAFLANRTVDLSE